MDGRPLAPPAPRAESEGTLHLRELLLFLSVHLDRAPGVMWPEHEHPALGSPQRPEALDDLAAELGLRTGLVTSSGRGSRTCEGARNPAAHLVIHQTEGAGLWRLRGDRADDGAGAFRHRLRSGEVLYIPARWSWTVELTPGAQYVVTDMTPPGS
ncbi:hypothetical protein ACIQZB_15475 [Streptomyces sp. NPDC097727]|uniref:hypothetical protein n=1 Tax=Streptomyces sp. NPDC097727 TaxID=3366092 RepID=UPI00382BB00B